MLPQQDRIESITGLFVTVAWTMDVKNEDHSTKCLQETIGNLQIPTPIQVASFTPIQNVPQEIEIGAGHGTEFDERQHLVHRFNTLFVKLHGVIYW